MAVLNAWQKIDRVLSGRPFGDGRDGAFTSGTIPSLNVKSCSGSASSTTLTADTDASPFAVGDVVLIHQSRGTGVGQWEINKISAVGSDQYTLSKTLYYTYTDSGASQAQVIKIPQYSSVNVSSGTWTLTDWNGDTGGLFPIACSGSFTHSGTITGSSKGFQGGAAVTGTYQAGKQGEGTVAAGGSLSSSANGNGGGGSPAGDGSYEGGGGAGGGHANAGGSRSPGDPFTGYPVTGGTSSGSADATTITFGGGAGSGATRNNSATSGTGGDGAGIIILFVKNISSISSIANNGGDGTDSTESQSGGGGGGAGGHVLIVCQTATLGTNLITVAAGLLGDAPDGSNDGCDGSVGRITVQHSSTVSGSTSPSFTDVTDSTLKESFGGGFFMST